MLEALVKDYNRKVGNLGFIYNGKIYLTKLLDRDNTFKTSNFPITINNTDSIIFDIVDPNSGETREREISFSVDNSGNIN
jgi:hypothetical protein